MTARIGAQIKALRQGKFSAEGLAERVEALGYRPYSRSALVNLEYGRKRTVDVGELLVLARALGVSPAMLLYPGLPGREVEVIPGQRSSSWEAAQWFGGHAPYWAVDDATGHLIRDDEAYTDEKRVHELVQQEIELRSMLPDLVRARAQAGQLEDATTDFLLSRDRQVKQAQAQLLDVCRQMVKLGAQPFTPAEDLARMEADA